MSLHEWDHHPKIYLQKCIHCGVYRWVPSRRLYENDQLRDNEQCLELLDSDHEPTVNTAVMVVILLPENSSVRDALSNLISNFAPESIRLIDERS